MLARYAATLARDAGAQMNRASGLRASDASAMLLRCQRD
jgi:hypothetical protein